MRLSRLPLAAVVAALVLPAPAALADDLLAPAPGAVNLAAGGGWAAWAAPAEDTGWNLVVRAPDGTVTTPVGGFAGPPAPAIGSGRRSGPQARQLLVAYARPDATGDDTDIFQLDLRTGRESRVAALATDRYRESAPSVQYGAFTFVRRGGPRNGVHLWSSVRGVRRVSPDTPRTTSFNGSRVAYAQGRSVVVRRVSREGRPLVQRTPSVPRSVQLSRYRVGWLLAGGGIFQTQRFGGSGATLPEGAAVEGTRALPPSTQSIAFEDRRLRLFVDAEGVKRANPAPFARG